MTIEYLVELVKMHHKFWSRLEIAEQLNDSLHEFCSRSEVYKKSSTDTLATGDSSYSLPSDAVEINSIVYDDEIVHKVNYIPIVDSDKTVTLGGVEDADLIWWIDNGAIGIAKYSSGKVVAVGTSENGDTITINYTSNGGTVSTGAMPIPEDLTQGLIYRALAYGYLLPENQNPQLAQLFEAKHEAHVRKGKEFAQRDYASKHRTLRTYNVA